MRYICSVAVLTLSLCLPLTALGEIIGNPGTQVGKKNLFVGIEYTTAMRTFDIDTNNLDTESEKILLKVTTGLTDWLDLYLRAGAANLMLDYANTDYMHKTSTGTRNWGNASINYDSDFQAGFGAGTRVRLLNFVNSRSRVFFDGGGFFYKTNDSIRWDISDGSVVTKKRDMKWADLHAALGLSKRLDYVDLTLGVGFSEIWWEISDENLEQIGTTTTKTLTPARDSFEMKKPVFGFIGLDFVLPYEYRISVQAGLRSMDDAEFTVAISQGLEKDFHDR